MKGIRFALLAVLLVAAPGFFAASSLASSGLAGQEAPDFALKSAGGANMRLSEHRGNVVMINFWATWCGPCRQEMPLLDSIYKQYKDKNFTLLGVNVEPDPKLANDWLKKQPVSFPVLYDVKSDVSNLYKVSGMPSTVFVDKKGNVRVIHRGYKPGDENEYMNNIRMLMREK